MDIWTTLTEAQATVIAAILTIFAAVFGVLLGSWLFGSRVKDLQSGVSASKVVLDAHRSEVENTLREIKGEMASLLETFGQVRGSLADQQSTNEEAPAPAVWEDIRAAWESVRDRIEQLAVRPDIDGRTRAKYARIDRRSYYNVINTMANDDSLPGDPGDFSQAYTLWMRYRNNRREPAPGDLAELRNIRDRVTAGQN